MSAAALDIAAAVEAERAWMEGLLARLVAAETTLGNEEAGQALIAEAFADCGLEPLSVPLDAARLRADPGSSPFSWSVAGKRNVVATWRGRAGAATGAAGGGGAGARPLADPRRPHRRRPAGERGACGRARRSSRASTATGSTAAAAAT